MKVVSVENYNINVPQFSFFLQPQNGTETGGLDVCADCEVYLKATQSLKSKFKLRRPKLPVAFSDFRNNRKQSPPPNSFGTTDVYCICDRARSIRLAWCNQIQRFMWLTAFLRAVGTSQINTVLGQNPI